MIVTIPSRLECLRKDGLASEVDENMAPAGAAGVAKIGETPHGESPLPKILLACFFFVVCFCIFLSVRI